MLDYSNFNQIGALLGLPAYLIAIALIWTLVWKGLALWKSARSKHIVWFVVFLVVNTLGIIEILYLFLFSKISFDKKTATRRAKPRASRSRRKKR